MKISKWLLFILCIIKKLIILNMLNKFNFSHFMGDFYFSELDIEKPISLHTNPLLPFFLMRSRDAGLWPLHQM